MPTMTNYPLLYTFRRCPYAIRARLAIAVSGIDVGEFEVDLSAKPAALLAISPKATVPVLQLADGTVLEQSLDIMYWALGINDPEQWLGSAPQDAAMAKALIAENDGSFKSALDGYKYPGRFPMHPVEKYRNEGGAFLAKLESQLAIMPFLTGDKRGLADAAIVPFVRQFVAVDPAWFDQCGMPRVKGWLDGYVASPLFSGVMTKPLASRPATLTAKTP